MIELRILRGRACPGLSGRLVHRRDTGGIGGIRGEDTETLEAGVRVMHFEDRYKGIVLTLVYPELNANLFFIFSNQQSKM